MLSIFELIAQEAAQAIDNPSPASPPIPANPNIPPAIAALQNAAAAVTNATDPMAFANAVSDFGDALADLGQAIGADVQNRSEAILVRVVQQRLPRLAAVLATTGAITPVGADGQQGIDWGKVRDVFTDPEVIFNEMLWDELLGDSGGEAEGRQIATILALIILFPQAVIAMFRGEMRVAALAPPETQAPGLWRDFRNRTQEWISVTLPLPDPLAGDPVPSSIFDLEPGLVPGIAGTFAGMATRSTQGGRRVTDFEAWLAITLDSDVWEYGIGDGWIIRVEPGIAAGFGRHDGNWNSAFRALSGDTSLVPSAGEPWRLSFLREAPDGDPDILLGPPFDTRLVVQDFQMYLELRDESPFVKFAMDIENLSMVLTNRWLRTWGESFNLMPNGIRYDADLAWSIAESEGFRLNFASALDVKIGIEKRVGPASSSNIILHSLRLTIPFDATQNGVRLRFEMRAHVSVQLWDTVVIVVDGFGAWAGWWKENLNDPDYEHIGLLPPTGAGIEISAGPVTAGGFIRYEDLPGGGERYSGALSVLIKGIGAHAFGIYERDGEDNKSALVVIGVRFGVPGIQLGYGLALSGIGGMIGIDRRLDIDALRERLTSGGAGNVLFLEDPIRNAPTILDDLVAIFPAEQGVIVVGPTVQISWISGVLSIDAGVVFEVRSKSLSKIVILGSVRAPSQFNFGSPTNSDNAENPIFNMRLDIAGVIDLDRGLVEFDGTLINSHAFRNFSLTGDGAFRARFGSGGYALLSLGGFHPDSPPPPLPLPDLTRIAITAHPGFFGVGYHLRAEGYFALTPNTFQLGGAIEAGYAAGPLNISGILGADVLIQYVPFEFDTRIFFAARVRWNSTTLAGVRVEGTLSGPGPTKLRGRACIEVLFFDICKTGEIRIGSDPPVEVGTVASIVQALASEISNRANLEAVAPVDSGIVLSEPEEGLDRIRLSPIGGLAWRQRRAPLELPLDRFEGKRLAVPQSIVVESTAAVGQVRDEFSPGNFLDLTESEQLNLPSFESHASGVSFAFGMSQGALVTHSVEIVNYTLPRPIPIIGALIALPIGVQIAARSRTAAARPARGAVRVVVSGEIHSVLSPGGGIAASGLTAHAGHRLARATGGASVTASDFVDMGVF
ncbi:MAG: hypothetical protein GY815_04630 [Gammaproteobacteria bacterium]|nr:hypothetical protein [Gammaproteobacteria bacterium]